MVTSQQAPATVLPHYSPEEGQRLQLLLWAGRHPLAFLAKHDLEARLLDELLQFGRWSEDVRTTWFDSRLQGRRVQQHLIDQEAGLKEAFSALANLVAVNATELSLNYEGLDPSTLAQQHESWLSHRAWACSILVSGDPETPTDQLHSYITAQLAARRAADLRDLLKELESTLSFDAFRRNEKTLNPYLLT
jgi:hypothetical protein